MALAALGAGAARDGQWPIAREAYVALATRYPGHPANEAATLDVAEALIRTGDARRGASAARGLRGRQCRRPAAPAARCSFSPRPTRRAARRTRRSTSTRGCAATILGPREWSAPTFAQARLLQGEGKWDSARPLLQKALDAEDPATVAEAAYRLGEGHRGAGQHGDAVQAYMTAAYLGPDTPWGRKALLGAGQSFAALRQNDSAVIVYRKLLAAKGAEPELVEAARKELKSLGVN